MASVFTHLRGIRRLLAICLILLKQVLAYGPFRLLFGSTEPARQVVGKYLAPAGLRLRVVKKGQKLWMRGSFGESRLHEYSSGLFFTDDGEALDLRQHPPAYRNIPLKRVWV